MHKGKKIIFAEGLMLISLFALLIVFQNGFETLTVITKSLTSILFVVTALIGYTSPNTKSTPAKLMLLAFICSMIGDVLLALDKNEGILFVLGVVSFATAHILFSVAYSKLMKVCKKDIIIAILIFIALLLLLCLGPFDFKGLFPVLIGYAAIISFMVTKALSLLKRRSESKAGITSIAIGGILFLLSDIVLLFWLFGVNMPLAVQSVNWVLYYSAQGFLSYAISEIKLIK